MNAIKATWKDGLIVPDEPVDWPDGCELVVEPLPVAPSSIGIDESQWRDEAVALADWHAWLQTIEPFEFAPGEEERLAHFDAEMRRYNIEAVRQQMIKESVS